MSTSRLPADTNCACEDWMRPACGGGIMPASHADRCYCVLHHPGREKDSAFREALERKLSAGDFNFAGVSFPDETTFSDFRPKTPAVFNRAVFHGPVNFEDARFGAEVDFSRARFFAEAKFHKARFADPADFSYARFYSRANFIEATFIHSAPADFSYVKFYGDADFTTNFYAPVSFNYATFSGEAYFRYALFLKRANFRSATFKTYTRFGGGGGFKGGSLLDLQFARVEKPEQVAFDSILLRPHWFVNVDPRKFEFTNVKWDDDLNGELEALEAREIHPAHRLLATAFRQLALNAEENHRYDEASKFRYRAMNVRRKERHGGYSFWTLDWWYWLASGYGEGLAKAFFVLIAVWLAFSLSFYVAGCADQALLKEGICITPAQPQGAEPTRPGFTRAVSYALGVMTLQRPEPRPTATVVQILSSLGTIFGPLQGALLALAIRRKFMR